MSIYKEILHLIQDPPLEELSGIFVRRYRSPQPPEARCMAEELTKLFKKLMRKGRIVGVYLDPLILKLVELCTPKN